MDQLLLVFVTVAEKKNFSRAASELHMTQPAVSQYIQSLERQMGVKLLERTNKYVRLNKAGEIVYEYAKEILSLQGKMKRLVDDLTNQASGDINIGASYTFGEYVLPSIIASLRKRYPLIKPSIMIGNSKEVAELVSNNQLDIGIIESKYRQAGLVIEPFATDVMNIMASTLHPLAKKDRVTMEDLLEVTWIVREEGSGTREATDTLFNYLGIEKVQIMEFGSTQVIKESVEAGLGVTFLSEWAVRKELALKTLTILPVRHTPLVRSFSLVKPESSFEPKSVSIFHQVLREEMKSIKAQGARLSATSTRQAD
ncbi:LysR family transcriptional regulator [Bacillus sp. FJAT-47783]|uniref:LysR family transcriptional regulator n=1 Tax=Bacillus sp. FJAT-47783 TaxID=2922712 RepID=UPI001FADB306|nr:LysR family transcriptional regulator [Bacillus sp. FJAT-47783]